MQSLSAGATFIHQHYHLFSSSCDLSFNEDKIVGALGEPNLQDVRSPTFYRSALTHLTCGFNDTAAIHLYPVLSIIQANPDLVHLHLENVRASTKRNFFDCLQLSLRYSRCGR